MFNYMDDFPDNFPQVFEDANLDNAEILEMFKTGTLAFCCIDAINPIADALFNYAWTKHRNSGVRAVVGCVLEMVDIADAAHQYAYDASKNK